MNLRAVDLQLTPNEASDLLPVHEPGLLRAEGWDHAYLTVLDEGRVEDCIAVLGHARGAPLEDGWSSRRVRFTAVRDTGRTEDAEALAEIGGMVWVLGSHYGAKGGPLQPRRHFAARFPVSALRAGLRGERPPLEVRRNRFALHRAINDALAAATLECWRLAPEAHEAIVGATVRRGAEAGKRWAGTVHAGDVAINVEGAAFRGAGRLLVGLRFPVTADGHPILVELPDPGDLFRDREPRVGAIWMLGGVGGPDEPHGVRALHHRGRDRFDVITGSLDAAEKGSALVGAHPEAGRARSTHWLVQLPAIAGGGDVLAEKVEDFGGTLDRVEGVAHADGHSVYVVDEESRVDLRFLVVG